MCGRVLCGGGWELRSLAATAAHVFGNLADPAGVTKASAADARAEEAAHNIVAVCQKLLQRRHTAHARLDMRVDGW